MFYLVGPLGQGASALQLLVDAITQDVTRQTIRAAPDSDTLPTVGEAQSLDVVCILIALLLGGMAAIWLLLAFSAFLYRLSRRELSWNPSWNAIVFPTSALAISTA
ncbi:voltage-dependent anion channel [Lasiosphaeris hirsuta]|uniref:Voltage-dependent anion channel n=1 Tax=Lasiosphaeris hirsuta TaxID=260670 RepID=A0AA40AS77_9PEZI|nr:voltage-dependent anion channel [Lasiosphaeris hirsuta]